MENLYLNIGIKLLVGFVLVLIYLKLAGKGSMAPISALDQVGNMVLSAIIGGPIYNPSISVFMLVAVAGMWAGLLLLIRYISFKRSLVKDIVDGKSVRLMKDGALLTDNFVKARLSVRDFIMLLHQRGYDNLDDLYSVWFEYNGQMSIVKKGEDSMATLLVDNGQLDLENLERLDFTEDWLLEEFKKQNYELKDVFLGEWHHNKLWLYPYSLQQTNA